MNELDIGTLPALADARAAWERLFKARIVQRLTVPGSEWTQEAAKDAADGEFEALHSESGEGSLWSLDEDPEASADEALSYWENDGDGPVD